LTEQPKQGGSAVEQLVINVGSAETRAALVVDEKLRDLQIDRAQHTSLTGNVYRGKVVRVIGGIQAAFVDIGQQRHGFLHAADVTTKPLMVAQPDHDGGRVDIRKLLHEGQEILVQVAKDAIENKGAKLTMSLSVATNALVLTQRPGQLGISRRIESSAERQRLKDILSKQLADTGFGLIVRTATEGASENALTEAFTRLCDSWNELLQNIESSKQQKTPCLVYAELPFACRILRDLAGPRVQRVTVNDEATYAQMRNFAEEHLPQWSGLEVLRYSDEDLFAGLGLEAQIQQALQPTYSLPSGAGLVFEQTQALVSIDVNTGSFLGTGGGADTAMEDTALHVNLEAAEVIPSQLRLRNLGGLVVIDFIDMEEKAHQQQVLGVLKDAFAADPSQVRVEDFSDHGTVQLSRKRVRQSLDQLLQSDSEEGADAAVESACQAIMRDLIKRSKSSKGGADVEFLVRADQAVVDRLLSNEGAYLDGVRAKIRAGVGVQAEPDFAVGQFDISMVQGSVG